MNTAAYVLVVYLSVGTGGAPTSIPQYVGHFPNCERANHYAEIVFPDAERTTCLHQDYINLPDDIERREITKKNHHQP